MHAVVRGDIPIEQDFSLKVLAEGESLEVLGSTLSLHDGTKVEIDHRIACGWRKFWAMKRLLLNQNVLLKKRLRLFDACISSSVLWCTRSWTPRADELRKLHTAQNRMLRRMCGTKRRPDEPWIDWLQRATHKARAQAVEARVRDWANAHSQYKWAWAGHVARRPTSTWLWRVCMWRDSQWKQTALDMRGSRPLRPSTRRWTKWAPLRRFCSEQGLGTWSELASNKTRWLKECDQFAEWLTASF